jgi:hypothetical protein
MDDPNREKARKDTELTMFKISNTAKLEPMRKKLRNAKDEPN